MAAALHNIIVGRGEDYTSILTILDNLGAPVDISLDTFEAQVRRAGGKPLVAEFTCALSDAVNGVMTIVMPRSESLKLDGNAHYSWDLFRITPTASYRLIQGDVRVENNITKLA